MGTKFVWQSDVAKQVLYFKDLKVNDHYVIDTANSHGAVYRKVRDTRQRSYGQDEYLQLEAFTGELFKPTASPVRLVEAEIAFKAKKPTIY